MDFVSILVATWAVVGIPLEILGGLVILLFIWLTVDELRMRRLGGPQTLAEYADANKTPEDQYPEASVWGSDNLVEDNELERMKNENTGATPNTEENTPVIKSNRRGRPPGRSNRAKMEVN